MAAPRPRPAPVTTATGAPLIVLLPMWVGRHSRLGRTTQLRCPRSDRPIRCGEKVPIHWDITMAPTLAPPSAPAGTAASTGRRPNAWYSDATTGPVEIVIGAHQPRHRLAFGCAGRHRRSGVLEPHGAREPGATSRPTPPLARPAHDPDDTRSRHQGVRTPGHRTRSCGVRCVGAGAPRTGRTSVASRAGRPPRRRWRAAAAGRCDSTPMAWCSTGVPGPGAGRGVPCRWPSCGATTSPWSTPGTTRACTVASTPRFPTR